LCAVKQNNLPYFWGGLVLDRLRVGQLHKIILVALLTIGLVGWSNVTFAQAAPTNQPPAGGGSGASRERAPSTGPRRHIATIIFAGLGGSVLGLSTLSFYGRPQDKLANIAIGFAVGVMVGTSYVTYRAATRPAEFYGVSPFLEFERQKMEQQEGHGIATITVPLAAYKIDF
jgi:hypothetical protein